MGRRAKTPTNCYTFIRRLYLRFLHRKSKGKGKAEASVEIWHGRRPEDVPLIQLASLTNEILVSHSGPDTGLGYVVNLEQANGEKNGNSGQEEIAGATSWNKKDQKAYGLCISLYEQHPVSMKMSGDPIADAFAICARKNSSVMLIADGVNWGEKSRLAARCALYGSMRYVNQHVFTEGNNPKTTQEALTMLRKSLDEAHSLILQKDGGLTTMCACMVLPITDSDDYAMCCVNVGDSYSFVFSHNHGIREVTIGSHDVSCERDIRDAGGALGPVDGENPELANLTFSLTRVSKGDIVFLTTDGVSDNFDPVVTKAALPKINNANSNGNENTAATSPTTSRDFVKPEMAPQERHIYALKEMERVIHEYELMTEEECSSQEVCGAMVQHILMLTDSKRKILENPALYAKKKMTSKQRQRRDSEIVEKMSKAPGKLDHASIVACDVGALMTEPPPVEEAEDEKRDVVADTLTHAPLAKMDSLSPSSPKSPMSPGGSRLSPRKFFSKFRNGSSTTNSLKSPTASKPFFLPISPLKAIKRRRSRGEADATTPTTPASPATPVCPVTPNPIDEPTILPLPADHPYRRSISFESSV